MSRHAATMLVFGAIGIVAVVVLGLGLAGGSTRIEISEIRPANPDAGPAIARLLVDEGFEVLGIRFGSDTYRVRVQFAAPADCLEHLVGGADWPLDEEACRSDVAIKGVVAGSGRTALGATIVVVEREISRECYEALRPLGAAPWPPGVAGCENLERGTAAS